MEDLSIALVCLFCIFFIMGPLVGAITSHRRAVRSNAASPGPKQLMRARRKLSTVTACSSVLSPIATNDTPDVEGTAAQLELGECPICIGPLMPDPDPSLLDNRRIRQALDELTTVAADRRRLSTFQAIKWGKKKDSNGAPEAETVEGADDVLTLNTCRHSFHARCLASWFLMARYDCPVCRVVYYRNPRIPERAVVYQSVYWGSRSGHVMGLG